MWSAVLGTGNQNMNPSGNINPSGRPSRDCFKNITLNHNHSNVVVMQSSYRKHNGNYYTPFFESKFCCKRHVICSEDMVGVVAQEAMLGDSNLCWLAYHHVLMWISIAYFWHFCLFCLETQIFERFDFRGISRVDTVPLTLIYPFDICSTDIGPHTRLGPVRVVFEVCFGDNTTSKGKGWSYEIHFIVQTRFRIF